MDMTQKYLKKTNALLHVYNRGNRKEEICRDEKDYIFLHNLAKHLLNSSGFDVLSFCVMPNHYHILCIQQGVIHISKVMQRLGSAYTKYFNKKYKLSGHLFQGTYKSKIITNEMQLKIVIKYIIDNPSDIGLPNNYPHLFLNQDLIDYYTLSFNQTTI